MGCIPCADIPGWLEMYFIVLLSFSAAVSELATMKKRLEGANNKKQSLEKDLQKAQADLKGIERGSV